MLGQTGGRWLMIRYKTLFFLAPTHKGDFAKKAGGGLIDTLQHLNQIIYRIILNDQCVFKYKRMFPEN